MSFLLRRVGTAILLVWIVASIVFLAIRMVPGDPAELLLSQGGVAPDAEAVAQLHERLDLDRPLLAQYLADLGHLLQGDLGTSLQDDSPVGAEITRRLRASVVLPMHRFATPLDEFMRRIGQQFVIDERTERSLTISRESLPQAPTVIILRGV